MWSIAAPPILAGPVRLSGHLQAIAIGVVILGLAALPLLGALVTRLYTDRLEAFAIGMMAVPAVGLGLRFGLGFPGMWRLWRRARARELGADRTGVSAMLRLTLCHPR